jgi:excinuclease ABC subunit C
MSAEILKNIPKLPGVYVFKDKESGIIYVGKAKCLYNRVSSYFRRQNTDWKVQELIREYATIEHIITKNEIEALLLEAQLIRTFKPKYNVLLKSGNPFLYLLVTEEEVPQLKIVRTKKEKGAYFGPFLQKQKARSVHDYLVRTLRLRMCSVKIDDGCLDYHLGRCAGNCLSAFKIEDYKLRISVARELLEGNYDACKKLLEDQIKAYNQKLEFEKSRNLSKYLQDLETIFAVLKTGFSERKYAKEISTLVVPLAYKIEQPLRALEELQILLRLDKKPIAIDCFDISHFQSSYLVGSCVRFTHGIPDKESFRRFKIKTLIEQNDYAALREIVMRRYHTTKQLPDVILIDGGKGQLNAVKHLFPQIPFISLAKREEILFSSTIPDGIKLDIKSPVGRLLIALRDYAHHFAISYHKMLRNRELKKAL